MIRRLKSSFALILIIPVIFFSSCATILNSKYQDVIIKTGDKSAEVYVEKDYRGSGNMVKTDLKRDKEAKQIRVLAKGYKPEYGVGVQHKRSPLYIMSWIPFGALLFIPPLFDNGDKAYDYSDTVKVKPRVKAGKRQEGESFIFPKDVTFDVKKEQLTFQYFKYDEYTTASTPTKERSGESSLQVKSSRINDTLYRILAKHGYIGTTSQAAKGNSDTLFITANIHELIYELVFPFSFENIYSLQYTSTYAGGNFMRVQTSITWELLNNSGETLFRESIFSSSGEFGIDEDNKKLFNPAMKDVIYTSLFEFLNTKEVQDLLKKR